ncbi:MerR family DNA-binding transcriptional regulator [Treponema primitia]|uniref:MerR family DNA-binding transcriptional regulator n=1 Tax=Treponema primitia TaxID=88058 RepID=UPI00191BDF82
MEYSIGEFSRLTSVGIHTLRYYEQENLILPNLSPMGNGVIPKMTLPGYNL